MPDDPADRTGDDPTDRPGEAVSGPPEPGAPGPSRFSRRRLLWGLGAAGGVAALGGVAFGVDQWVAGAPPPPAGGVPSYRSRPDLRLPRTSVVVPADEVAPGYVLLAPSSGPGQYGPMILDNLGRPVWIHPVSGPWPEGANGIGKLVATNFQVQDLRGEPVLTWWQGHVILPGYGQGRCEIFDQRYRHVATVVAGNGRRADLHEFVVTARGTALVTFYEKVDADLSPVGGPVRGTLLGCGFQEIDIASGRVLFEWKARDFIGLDESYNPVAGKGTPDRPWDFFHINSVDVDADGSYLISARHTWAVYKVDRTNGAVVWRLNGKQSDYAVGRNAHFAWQHDARSNPDGTISIFDDGAGVFTTTGKSRGILLRLDEAAMTARLVEQYVQPGPISASSQGSVQMQPNGNAFVGWGSQPFASEFSHDGRLLFDLELAKGGVSYRAFRFPWSGHPTDRPAVALEPRSGGQWVAFASWNGATEVDHWEVLSGQRAGSLQPVARARRAGFETKIPWKPRHATHRLMAVAALRSGGRTLGRSATQRLTT